jgi:hypothetical protein
MRLLGWIFKRKMRRERGEIEGQAQAGDASGGDI